MMMRKVKKYHIHGMNDEIIGLALSESMCQIVVGCRKKFKPFLDHVCFELLGLTSKELNLVKERQKHKIRYYFDIDVPEFKRNFYKVNDRYKVDVVESLVKYT